MIRWYPGSWKLPLKQHPTTTVLRVSKDSLWGHKRELSPFLLVFPLVTTAQIVVSSPCVNTCFSGDWGSLGHLEKWTWTANVTRRAQSGTCTPAAWGASACQLSLLVSFALCGITTCSVGVGFFTVISGSCLSCPTQGNADHVGHSGFLKTTALVMHFFALSIKKSNFTIPSYPTAEVVMSLGQCEGLLSMLSYTFCFHFWKNLYVLCACRLGGVSKGTKRLLDCKLENTHGEGCCFGV